MRERLETLLEVNRAITSSLDYDELNELIVEKAAEVCSADRCALLLADDEGKARVVAQYGGEDEDVRDLTVPFDERVYATLRERLGFTNSELFIAVPVIHREHVIGMLAIESRRVVEDRSEVERLLGAFADQAAIALDHASRYRALLEESQAARKELEAVARQKDEFLAMLAHELRNPLAAIISANEAVRSFLPQNPRVEHLVQAAGRQSRLMARLLDDLLDVSRVTRGKIELRYGTVVVQDIVDQAVQAVDGARHEAGHNLHVDAPSDPVRIDGDAARLVQIVTNLLANAIRYTEPGGNISLTVRADGEMLELSVRDDGAGITQERLGSIFELFVQSDRDAARSSGGLGIGLTLVERLVQMHGGTVHAHSDGVGLGSEFIVRLPLAARDRVKSTAPEEDADVATATEGRRRVLVVEDNHDVGESLAAWLEQQGHGVDLVHDAEAAMDLASRCHPDVVLLDIGLPGMDGYQLARLLRRELAEPPTIVAATGYGSEEDRRMARDAGIEHHMVKPVDLKHLSRLVSSAPIVRV